jgi:ferredoxin-thioredoxin reductase catalytic chain
MTTPSQANIDKMWAYARKYAEKSGTFLHPDRQVTETVVNGLAIHIEQVGKPLCPCNFYPDPKEEAKLRRWVCACDEMQNYKYCHCLLFVNAEGVPITEYLPEDHEGRQAYGVVKDPLPGKGRAMARVLQKQGRTEESGDGGLRR